MLLIFYSVGQTFYLEITRFYLPFRNGLNNPKLMKQVLCEWSIFYKYFRITGFIL